MRRLAIGLLLLCATAAGAATIHNDDSCDISVMPAATLLLPYFEVDINSPQTVARTTIFTVVNTSRLPQIARVTLWTDWAFPVLTFNIFLTGYDVQAINLYDVIGPRGTIAPASGTSIGTASGALSLANTANPNFVRAAQTCDRLPGVIPASLLTDIRTALTAGTYQSCGTAHVGGTHLNAIGYATIDVMSTCGVSLPTDQAYYNEILFDNVLGGDWETIDPNPATGNTAGGNPLVHIRAIPEGGPAGVVTATNLPYTFYNRFTPHFDRDTATMDRRQPLPATFSARYIQGGAGAFNTSLQIWREGVTGNDTACNRFASNGGTAMSVKDVVRFDEHENPTVISGGVIICCFVPLVVMPSASSTPTSSALYPPLSTASGDLGGWIYLNLDNGGSTAYSSNRPLGAVDSTRPRPSQNWVVVSQSAEARFQASFDATSLANGCTPATVITNATTTPIAPGPNVTP